MVILRTLGSASQGIMFTGSSSLVGQNGFDWTLEWSSMPGLVGHFPSVHWYNIYCAGKTTMVLRHSPSLLRNLGLDFVGEPAVLPVSCMFHLCVPFFCYWKCWQRIEACFVVRVYFLFVVSEACKQKQTSNRHLSDLACFKHASSHSPGGKVRRL